MVLSVFGDESSDEMKERVFAISGLMGTEEEWRTAEAAWVAKTGDEVFHAADWEHKRRNEEYKLLAQTLAGSQKPSQSQRLNTRSTLGQRLSSMQRACTALTSTTLGGRTDH